jgi:hypothetical protein
MASDARSVTAADRQEVFFATAVRVHLRQAQKFIRPMPPRQLPPVALASPTGDGGASALGVIAAAAIQIDVPAKRAGRTMPA